MHNDNPAEANAAGFTAEAGLLLPPRPVQAARRYACLRARQKSELTCLTRKRRVSSLTEPHNKPRNRNRERVWLTQRTLIFYGRRLSESLHAA